MSVMKRLVLTAVLVLASSGVAGVTVADERLPRVAFFGFQLVNTSPQPTTPEETQRIHMLNDMFQQKLDASGRFKIVSIPAELRDKIASAAEISGCNGCERDFALQAGADWAAWGTVQKVSNLILNINVYIEDAQAKQMKFAKSVDIRGNTDESWQRGLDYMLNHYLFQEPYIADPYPFYHRLHEADSPKDVPMTRVFMFVRGRLRVLFCRSEVQGKRDAASRTRSSTR
jgi:Protein of unknown function (DUF2380)